jgi:hypothetical protein
VSVARDVVALALLAMGWEHSDILKWPKQRRKRKLERPSMHTLRVSMAPLGRRGF